MNRKAHTMGIPIAAATDGSYGDRDDTACVRVQHDVEVTDGKVVHDRLYPNPYAER